MEPTLLVNTTNDMSINREELFAPIACVIKADNYEDAFPFSIFPLASPPASSRRVLKLPQTSSNEQLQAVSWWCLHGHRLPRTSEDIAQASVPVVGQYAKVLYYRQKVTFGLISGQASESRMDSHR